MADSNETLLAIATTALDAWGLSGANIQLVARSENTVYRVDTKDESLALRVHRPGYHNLQELISEQLWTAALQRAGIDVPVARQTTDGHYYACIGVPGSSEQRHVGMVEWIDGEPLQTIMERETDDEILLVHMEQLGQIAARIHNQAVAWEVPGEFARHHFDADGLMGETPFWGPFWLLPELDREQVELIQTARRAIHKVLADCGNDPGGTYSMIHADLHTGNLLVSETSVHVIDFDDAGFGWHQYELAVALFSLWQHARFDDIQDALVKGYRCQRAIDDAALELLPMFLLIRALVRLGWIHHRPELDRSDFLPGLITLACERSEAFLANR